MKGILKQIHPSDTHPLLQGRIQDFSGGGAEFDAFEKNMVFGEFAWKNVWPPTGPLWKNAIKIFGLYHKELFCIF